MSSGLWKAGYEYWLSACQTSVVPVSLRRDEVEHLYCEQTGVIWGISAHRELSALEANRSGLPPDTSSPRCVSLRAKGPFGNTVRRVGEMYRIST